MEFLQFHYAPNMHHTPSIQCTRAEHGFHFMQFPKDQLRLTGVSAEIVVSNANGWWPRFGGKKDMHESNLVIPNDIQRLLVLT